MLGLLVAALGCGCSAPAMMAVEAGVPDVCQPTGSTSLIAEPEAYAGGTVTVHAAGRFVTCDGGADVPVDVAVQLHSPSDESLPLRLSVRSGPYHDDDGGLAPFFGFFDPDAGATLVLADVTFDTPELGLYHLTMQFQPNLGTLQQDVLSMVDRRGTGPKTSPTSLMCGEFDVVGGFELCLEGSSSLHSMLGGAVVSTVPADDFVADGNEVWTYRVNADQSVSVIDYTLEPDGTFSIRGGGSTLPLFSNPESFNSAPEMVVSGGQVMLVAAPLIAIGAFDGGVIVFHDEGPLPMLAIPPVAATFVPDQGALVGFGLFQPGMNEQLCLLDFVHGTMECKPSTPLADDGDVLWTVSGSGALVAWQVDGGPSFTSTTTNSVEATVNAAFQESGFPFSPAQVGVRNQGSKGLAAQSPFGLIVRRPLPPPVSSVAGYGAWPSFAQVAVTRNVLWSLDFVSNGSTAIHYIER